MKRVIIYMDDEKLEFDEFVSALIAHCNIKDKIRELSIVLSKAHKWQQISKAKFREKISRKGK